MIPSTVQRVPQQTPGSVNRRIARTTRENIAFYASQGRAGIDRRLQELDEEWDIERMLEANAASVALAGVILGATIDRRLFVIPGLVAGFLLQHAIQGWCPPLPILRHYGFRTADEINQERMALKLLRGDFDDVPASIGREGAAVDRILAAVRR
jgi:hypothetical protein